VRLDDESLLASEPHVFGGPTVGSKETFQVQFLLNDRRANIAYESFGAGSTVNWAFWHDEVHIITGGTARVTYTLPPNHRLEVTKEFTQGDAYLIPNGTRARFEVASEAPYLHVCVIMPRFVYDRAELTDSYG
jgi:mannose-6-phosphate isomerase-like protein (cupin superfamily)